MKRLASSTRAIRMNTPKKSCPRAYKSPLPGEGKKLWMRAAGRRDTIPAPREIKNHGQVTGDFTARKEKKAAITGSAAANNKSRSIQVPLMVY